MFGSYGNKDLLTRFRVDLRRMRVAQHPQVRQVMELIDEYGCGLEQEALLLE